MSRWNDDHFESILSGQTPAPPEGQSDQELLRRLETHRAIKDRLRRAFAGVKPDAALEARLRRRLAAADQRSAATVPAAGGSLWSRLRLRRSLAPVLAAAALIVAAAIPLSVLFLQQPAQAAQKEFAAIHGKHQAGGKYLFRAADVAQLAAHLKAELPYEPGIPRVRPGDKVCGCCVDRFLGQPVGSYLLETPQGLVSLIVAQAAPDTLDLSHKIERDGRIIYACGYAECRIAGVRSNGVSYYAVGKLPRETLIDLLMQVVPAAGNSAGGP